MAARWTGKAERVVFAPDSFKGTIRAAAAAQALALGWRELRPQDDVVVSPMADGGEGTLDAIAARRPDARRIPVHVSGPTGRPVDAYWLLLEDGTGVVELANTSGIELLPTDARPNALLADSYGFGQAILAALEFGVEELILCIGGSASSDGGAGMLTALGASLYDDADAPIGRGALGLESVSSADVSAAHRLPSRGAKVLTDVTAPLLGPLGAASIFGPQKGATLMEVKRIEAALERWKGVVGLPDTPGAGAAGGAGYGLMAWGAKLVDGANEVAGLTRLNDHVQEASLVVTGEGSFDPQSRQGKVPALVQAYAALSGIPCALVAGRVLDPGAEFSQVISLTDLAGSAQAAMSQPEQWLIRAGQILAHQAER